ncbi:MAG: NUDIX hydrolase [Actinomycetota bacterium]
MSTGADGAPAPPEVVAAGGIVVRPGDGGPEVLIVHRPRYDDWSFPKGKQDPGETDEETALREVAEETGVTCVLGRYLGAVRYRDHRDRAKVVHYWRMEPDAGHHGAFVPNDEVDRLHWCGPEEAATLLTYGHDRALLTGLEGG